MQTASKVFSDIASIPTVFSGQFTNNSCDDFEFSCTIRKYEGALAKKSTCLLASRHVNSVIEQASDIKFRTFSPDGALLIVGRSEKKPTGDSKPQISIEIWKNSSFKASVLVSDIHGDFCLDDVFGSLSWSPSGSKFMYVAERKRDEQKGFEKFVYAEHFGEKLSTIIDPVLCVLDLETCKVNVLSQDDMNDIFPSQPVFGDDDTIYFSGIEVGSKRLGMSYIYCRPSAIYRASVSSQFETECISDRALSSRSPISSASGFKVIYLSNSLAGSHFKCSQLICYDVSTRKSRVIVDIVDDPRGGFPGIFAQRIPNQRFKSTILIPTCWRNDRPIVEVDVETGSLERLFPELSGSWRILDSRNDHFLITVANPTCPGRIFIWNSKLRNKSEADLPLFRNNSLLTQLSESAEYEPIDISSNVSIVLIKPTKALKPLPLIILPHGGPNSVYSVDYILYPAALAMLGYAVASINYTGSIGFGQHSIKALEGNIGARDVEDCFICTEHLLRTGAYDKSRVWLLGGSHGGYLAAYLTAKYPDHFRGAILRNPVIDLPSMLVTSDITDWVFGQLGLSFDQLRIRCPSPEELVLMRERSPSSYYKSVKCPSLILLGAQDLRVHHSQGLYWSNLLRSNGVKVEVLLFPDANHGLETAESEKFGFLSIIDFISKN